MPTLTTMGVASRAGTEVVKQVMEIHLSVARGPSIPPTGYGLHIIPPTHTSQGSVENVLSLKMHYNANKILMHFKKLKKKFVS